MAHSVKTFQVRLQEESFCVATGPHDSAVSYPYPVEPFAPLLLKSPATVHLYYPSLFPGKVLTVHAEHLGHFLALQKVPPIDAAFERTLYQGLCDLFTQTKVLSVYNSTLTDGNLLRAVSDVSSSEDREGGNAYPSVLVKAHKNHVPQIVSLLGNLLKLFDVDDLCHEEIRDGQGREPEHMLFLYLIQLLAVFVSSNIQEKDLATIMSVASAVYLEANFCDPLCAATLLKPMFIPYYDYQQGGKKKRKQDTAAEAEHQEPEATSRYYRLFTGYELDNKGCDVATAMERNLRWTGDDVWLRMQGCWTEERESKKLWFVAPQMGDRMRMVREAGLTMMGAGLTMMGGQMDEKARKICSYLMSDNVMAYMQCAVFGTISNMLPCHANSDFTEPVITAIKGSMSKLSDAVRHQSANLMTELSGMTESCLHTTGVGFAAQEKGTALHFGKVFTGPEEKRPPQPTKQGKFGVFTSVTLGIASTAAAKGTMMNAMLTLALKGDSARNSGTLRDLLSAPHRPAATTKVVTDAFFYARYHHRFNRGEFTEVACVKAVTDPNYNQLVHADGLTSDAKYQLTVSLGALPMCTLTLAMTVRQAVMMVMGFLCSELARVVYSPKATDKALCQHITSLSMAGKFRHGKDEEPSGTVFEASYADLLKVTGPAFSNPGRSGINFDELESMEWLRAEDTRLPDYIRKSLNMIGDTRAVVARIMQEKNKSYNRVLFLSETGVMKFASVLANDEYMIHAPMMIMSSMRVFANNSDSSYGSVKLCKTTHFYPVKVFSNACIDTTMYIPQGGKDLSRLTGENRPSTIDNMVEKIKRGVSYLLPRIHVNRIWTMYPDLNVDEFATLVSAVKSSNIEVTGEEESCRPSASGSAEGTGRGSALLGAKRVVEELGGSPERKKPKRDSELTIFAPDVDYGFDDSE